MAFFRARGISLNSERSLVFFFWKRANSLFSMFGCFCPF
jgi:hypothetical protein